MIPIGYVNFDIALTNGIEGASICSSDRMRRDRLECHRQVTASLTGFGLLGCFGCLGEWLGFPSHEQQTSLSG
jgi:hypothetical protein